MKTLILIVLLTTPSLTIAKTWQDCIKSTNHSDFELSKCDFEFNKN